MRQINLSVAAMPISPIPLFYQGEMNATVVRVDIGSWVAKFGDEEGQIHYQRPGDSAPYAVNVVRDGDVLEWTVSAVDVIKPGTGQMQVVYTSGDTVVRSAIVPTRCAGSLGQEPEPPTAERPWYDQAMDAANRAEAAADRAEDASTLVWVPEVSESGDLSWTRGDSETPPEPVNIMGPAGPRGETGPRGPQGETGSQGLRGETGPQGQVGATPNLSIGTVSTLAAGSSATATITGTAENPTLNLGIPAGADGQDGADGAPGAPGADGGYYTPSVTQPTDSTMQVAFTPSQAEMPSVEPVTVALPAYPADGNNGEWEEIADVTTEEDLVAVLITKDKHDNPFSLKKVMVTGVFLPISDATEGNGGYCVRIDFNASGSIGWNSKITFSRTPSKDETASSAMILAEVTGGMFAILDKMVSFNENSVSRGLIYSNHYELGVSMDADGSINIPAVIDRVNIASYQPTIGAGSRIRVWGIRA